MERALFWVASKARGQMELRITVKGRRTGKTYTIPVWFVQKGEKIFLLAVNGSDTNWYKNILADSNMILTVGRRLILTVGRRSIRVKAKPTNEKDRVKETIEMFNVKYGAGSIKGGYKKLDVSVEIPLSMGLLPKLINKLLDKVSKVDKRKRESYY